MERLTISNLFASDLPRQSSWENANSGPIVVATGTEYPFVVIDGHHALARLKAAGREDIDAGEFTLIDYPDADSYAEVNVQSGCPTMSVFTDLCAKGEFWGDELEISD